MAEFAKYRMAAAKARIFSTQGTQLGRTKMGCGWFNELCGGFVPETSFILTDRIPKSMHVPSSRFSIVENCLTKLNDCEVMKVFVFLSRMAGF